MERAMGKVWRRLREACGPVRGQRGQGTTEYAIIVGVLAVIAMIAIAAFRDNIADLWTAIQEGIGGLA